MDQVKIGKFISDERKAKGYTQKQLSELLGISDKTISKWECGNGFPEASLLLPLCNELEITVNELLTGERISQQNYKKKAEENMVNMIREKEENKQKILLTTIIGVISTITFVTLLLVVCFYTDVITLPIKIVLMIIALSVFGVGLYVAMWGDRKIGYFKCRNCNELFTPTFMQYNMGMHLLSTRYLKCPHCKTRTWCRKVMTKE
ncbi:helix-turn-helix transcriptional regulator [Suilimivivens sp.]|uniref:helix-turn-helix domain-containing protein n=1 Tax=Suilimivivens sp. TaxID=2981669 RepID=UPI00307AAA54